MADNANAQADSSRKTLEASFTNFVATLRLQTLVFLGAVPNPATKQPTKDLTQAKYLIDTLSIIEEKTKGNLDKTEQDILERVLYEVRMLYVQASEQAPPAERE